MIIIVPFALLVLCATMLAIAATRSTNRTLRLWLRVSVLLLCVLNLVQIGLWTWMLRDGLGPDSVPSEGVHALVLFLSDYWIPLGIGLMPVLLMRCLKRTSKLPPPPAA